ncbi:MAG: right-handed parallel beta-helix repeat-containing protein [Candidatus Aminicenantes bacterium]|nr:right-handed parallel beta-helix repeat-containing protein [Candidatus Aminicenantes bacterium]
MRLFNFNKCFAVGVIFMLSCGGFMLSGQYPSPSCPVYNATDSTCYQTIQAAIDAASSGDLIKLYSTTFYENITIDVSITLEGYHMFSTSIQGDCTEDVVTITAAGVTIKSLGILGCGNNNTVYHGIKIESANNTVVDTMIAECYRGIYTSGYSGNIIRDNLISTTWDYYEGIIVSGSNNKIYGNTFIRAATETRVGWAIIILSASNTDIYQNSIRNHEYAIYVFAASNNNIFANTIEDNDYGIYLFSTCEDNKIHHNNFLDNDIQAYTYYAGTNQWDNGCPSGGNYWDNNTNCTDVSDCNAQQSPDGICDSSFSIPYDGTANYDNYPLAAQWSPMCGNVDGSPDYAVNWDDYYYLIEYLYGDGLNAPVPPCAADMNCTGTLTIADVSILVDHLNNGTPLTGCCCQ